MSEKNLSKDKYSKNNEKETSFNLVKTIMSNSNIKDINQSNNYTSHLQMPPNIILNQNTNIVINSENNNNKGKNNIIIMQDMKTKISDNNYIDIKELLDSQNISQQAKNQLLNLSFTKLYLTNNNNQKKIIFELIENIGFFVLATLLTCAEIYKCYIDNKCVPQRFTVRKLISTRYNLNEPQYNARYQSFMPALDLQNQQYTYQPEEYNYLNNDYNPDLPTQEELEKAEQYKNNVPNYEIENYPSFNGDVKVGVVKDNPSYASKNESNEIPPGCAEKNKEYIDQFAAKYKEEGLLKYPSFD